VITADDARIRRLLPWPALIDAIARTLREGCVVAPRAHHDVDVPGARAATLLLMPAWAPGRLIGVKVVTVFPDNAARGVPTLDAAYLVFDGNDGRMLACLPASELTARRTAAASALAARHLARAGASRLLVVGTGRVARELAVAHCSVRPIGRIRVWGRDAARARAFAAELVADGTCTDAAPVPDLRAATGDADVITCATMSTEPLVLGPWLAPGAHLDLVGAFKPAMREADVDAIRRASLFVDTRHGALHEAGEIVAAIDAGAIGPEHIRAVLAELAAGAHPGRTAEDEITVFKSVGMASEDLAAASLVLEALGAPAAPG